MKMPATVYTVLTTFPNAGFGSAGDATEFREEAFELYSGCIADEQPTRVIAMTFDVETGEIETSRDVTSDFQDDLDLLAETSPDAPEPSDSQCDDAYDMHRIAAE
ncbi:MAG: hypothetical protein ACRBB0_15340 [Pelagimonas sp.]|uniref:hypothetical protein n=1 Tax=Pelagimonas sp. TaxID=2073170 RepID=UPI003D6B3F99